MITQRAGTRLLARTAPALGQVKLVGRVLIEPAVKARRRSVTGGRHRLRLGRRAAGGACARMLQYFIAL